jgi:cyclopropane fatty-acyl-phospholipid synthase-like methyltransferase
MTEFELMLDFHLAGKRQGPGSTDDTLKALSFMDLNQDKVLKIADIGCGSGGQTMTLARKIKGEITAVDLFPQFLAKLKTEAEELGLADKIKTLKKSMDDLPFGSEEFDIIWSEGAIYIMGFEEGIKQWKKHLKVGGYLAVSEITWTTASRPAEIEEYWNNEYPEIDTASNKIKVLEENGFSPVGYFYLPESSWIDNYYHPMEERFEDFLIKHNYSEAAEGLVENQKDEIKIYKEYKDYFSYGFYIAQKLN